MKKITILINLLLVLMPLLANAGEGRWLPGWKQTSALGGHRAGAAVAATDTHIYLVGGVDGRIFLRTVEYAPILADGRLGAWRATAILPEARGFAEALVYQGYLYVVGGGKGKHGKELLASSARAPLLADGSLGPWETLTAQMQVPRRCSKVCEYQGHLVTLGGFGGVLLDSVEVAALDGPRLQSWRLNRQMLTMPRYVNSVKKLGDYLYALGGHHPSEGRGLQEVEYAYLPDILADRPKAWRATQPMRQGRYGHASARWQQQVLVLGGISGLEYLDSIESSRQLAPGELAPWQTQALKLPQPMANFAVAQAGEWLYLLGGATREGYLNQVYMARFKADGQLGNWFLPAEQPVVTVPASEQGEITPAQVLEVLQSDQYSYLQVRGAQGSYWLAAPRLAVRAGDWIEHSAGVAMGGYYSRSLRRRFDRILFVSQVKQINR